MENNEIAILILVVGLIALVAVKLLQPVLRKFGVLDIPNHRSSHSTPTMRGGGVGPLAGQIAATVAVMAFFNSDKDKNLLIIIFVFAVSIGFVGLYEDVVGLSSRIRAGLQLVLGFSFATVVSFQIEIGLGWIIVASVLIAANVNFVNFMDGLNGISGLFALVFGLSYFLIGYLENSLVLTIGGGVVAVTFGTFLYWNLTPPGVFLGDVGSYLLGAATILLFLTGVWSGIDPVLLFAPLSVYWVDTISTLFRRTLKREKIFEAHRSHVYQRLSLHGFSHLAVSSVVGALSASVTLIALLSRYVAQNYQYMGFLSIVIIWIFYLSLPKIMSSRRRMP